MQHQYVWVISPDNGCEGLAAPIRAFLDRGEADAAYELLSLSYQSFKLHAVPIWAPKKPDATFLPSPAE
jgi:hypothetical protein